MKEDKIFGTIYYGDAGWERAIKVQFGNKEHTVCLHIEGEEDGVFEPDQYTAYTYLLEKWISIQEEVIQSLLAYYIEMRQDLGYDIEENVSYPPIETTEELLEMIILDEVQVAYEGVYGERSIGLGFSCTWNEEEGIGIRLSKESVVEIGYHEIIC